MSKKDKKEKKHIPVSEDREQLKMSLEGKKMSEPKQKRQKDRPFKSRAEFIEFCKQELQDFIKSGGRVHYPDITTGWDMEGNRISNRVGAVVAFQDGDTVRIGWSQLHEGLDQWNKYLGVHLAIKRARQEEAPKMRDEIWESIQETLEPAARYYKDAKKITFHGKQVSQKGKNRPTYQLVELPIVRVNQDDNLVVLQRSFSSKS